MSDYLCLCSEQFEGELSHSKLSPPPTLSSAISNWLQLYFVVYDFNWLIVCIDSSYHFIIGSSIQTPLMRKLISNI